MEINLLHNSKIDRTKWNDLMNQSNESSIYTLSSFLDALSADWEAIVVIDNEEYEAVMPLLKGRKYIFTHYLQPILAKYWGIIIRNQEYKNNYEKYSYIKKLTTSIIEKIPVAFAIAYNLHPNFAYALPFHWAGYDMKTRFTYHIPLTKSLDKIRAEEFEYQSRADSNKALRDGVTISKARADDLIHILSENSTHGKPILETKYLPILKKIADANDNIHVFKAELSGKVIGACMVGLHQSIAYYMYANKLSDTISPLSLLTEEAIGLAIDSGCLSFDFTGMMNPNIEFYWRKFGAIPQTYIQIRKGILS